MARRRSGRDEIGGGRQALHWGGWALIAIGLVLFLSTFVSIYSGMSEPLDGDSPKRPGLGEPGWWEGVEAKHKERRNDIGSTMLRAFLGMGLMAAGQAMRRVGARGIAGSGLTLDPKGARHDLAPWTRAGGGMLRDALDEVGPIATGRAAEPAEVVRVRCGGCKTLNDEDSVFCKQCGTAI